MIQSTTNRTILFLFRILMGWTFLYAGIHHFGDNTFVTGFLSHTKTFHGVYAPLTSEKTKSCLKEASLTTCQMVPANLCRLGFSGRR
jgi:uncharacterized membrane protein YphA (DoxX/SURF4 family)